MIDHNTDLLLIIDMQNDFCPEGALAVPDGDQVVPVINRLQSRFTHRVLTQDWHPLGHSSFASTHAGTQPFQTIEADYGTQVLWPDHCVQGTPGADFHNNLATTGAELIIRKGFRKTLDSYSAFFENDQTTPTGLTGYLRERNFKRVYLCGLATDYCVAWSALDARTQGFTAVVIEDACRAIDLNGSLAQAKQQLTEAGVHLFSSDQLGV